MPAVKISVSVDERELQKARRFIGSRELSAYVNEALRAENQHREQLALLAELDRQFGPIAEDHPDAIKAKRKWQDYVSFSTRVRSRQSRPANRSRAKSSKKR